MVDSAYFQTICLYFSMWGGGMRWGGGGSGKSYLLPSFILTCAAKILKSSWQVKILIEVNNKLSQFFLKDASVSLIFW